MNDTQKIAIVTGGSRGIGKACAFALAKQGYRVVLTYVSKPELADEVVKTIQEQGGEAEAVLLDVADREAVTAFFKDRKEAGIDVLVNNAGITKDGLLIRMKDEDWDKVLHINLTGAFTCLREAAKIMARQRRGRIINISSIAGEMGNAGQANYSAAKAGLIGLTKTTARELAGRGVTVNAVTPGAIETDMTQVLSEKVREGMLAAIPMGRLGTPEDIAGAVCFLASDSAAYITGHVLSVNGGMYM